MEDEDVCPICFETPKYPCDLPCKHVFCYMCIKRVAESKKPCPKCNAVIPDFVLENIKLSDEKVKLTTEKWLYSGRNNGWWYYSSEDSEVIDECWQLYKKQGKPSSISLKILGRYYIINFDKMIQYSVDFSVTRNIKRSTSNDCLIKGISGIHIVKKEDLPVMPKPIWDDPDRYIFDPEVWEYD